MKKVLFALMIPAAVLANDQCVLQDRTVTRGTLTIAERTSIRTEVVPAASNQRRCLVNFRARIGTEWHTAFGEYEWDGHTPREQACAVAVKRAEDDLRERVGRSQVLSEKILICNDNPDLRTLRQSNPGTVADLSQFRPHPEYIKEFYHNGTVCRWFVDSMYTGRDIRTFQGIICRIQDNRWVVVDKF